MNMKLSKYTKNFDGSNQKYRIKDLPFNRVFFWSYDFKHAELPISEIIQIIIQKGDIDDVLMLFKVFPLQQVKEIYMNKIRPILSGEDEEYYKLRPDAMPNKNSVWLMDMIFRLLNKYVAEKN